jgi:FkbM family methyltransferase
MRFIEILKIRFIFFVFGWFEPRRLSQLLITYRRRMIQKLNFSSEISDLVQKKISVLDIGARGGPAGHTEFVNIYKSFIDYWLIEPEENEAQALRDRGFKTISKIVSDVERPKTLKITRDPGASSLLEPTGPWHRFYKACHGGINSNRFDVIKEITLEATTIDRVQESAQCIFDIIKIDTQGSELQVLEGLKSGLPFAILTEVSFFEIYKGQVQFHDLQKFLFDKGYIVADLFVPASSPMHEFNVANNVTKANYGVPLHGDCYFVLDWSRGPGKALVEQNIETYIAILLMLGKVDLVLYLEKFENIQMNTTTRHIIRRLSSEKKQGN